MKLYCLSSKMVIHFCVDTGVLGLELDDLETAAGNINLHVVH